MEKGLIDGRSVQRASGPRGRHAGSILSAMLFYLVVLVGCGLAAVAVLAPELKNRRELQEQVDRVQADIQSLNKTYHRLRVVRGALRIDPAYTGRVVRRELGYSRPGEEALSRPASRTAESMARKAGDSAPLGYGERIVEVCSRPRWRLGLLLSACIMLSGAFIFSMPSKRHA